MFYNSIYTLVHHYGECPIWKDKVCISGKYRLPDLERPYYTRFVSAECEIVKNIRLPEHKRDKRLSLYSFCSMGRECPLLHDFPPEIEQPH